ncbi:MAG: NapC/NirT family cytochrome c [Deltaproteobacteria bacterium]|jgi:cytochrome c nitrite reductase small subunit|nr:NapC/NirT family cytochrome c [Deltaproteobacteria bacterium]
MPNSRPSGSRGKFFALFSAFVLGIAALLGFQQFLTATDGTGLCATCHVMQEEAWTHKQSVHAKQACNECHTPSFIVYKLPFKAWVGAYDLAVNTLGEVPDTIHADDVTKDIIQANCIRCHYATIQEVNMTSKQYCTDCHRTIPHMNKLPIDRRKAADA